MALLPEKLTPAERVRRVYVAVMLKGTDRDRHLVKSVWSLSANWTEQTAESWEEFGRANGIKL